MAGRIRLASPVDPKVGSVIAGSFGQHDALHGPAPRMPVTCSATRRRLIG
jgi:hypothetical protein